MLCCSAQLLTVTPTHAGTVTIMSTGMLPARHLPTGAHPTFLTPAKVSLVERVRSDIPGGKYLADHVFEGPYVTVAMPVDARGSLEQPAIIDAILGAFDPIRIVYLQGVGQDMLSSETRDLRVLPDFFYRTLSHHSGLDAGTWAGEEAHTIGTLETVPTEADVITAMGVYLPVEASLISRLASHATLDQMFAVLEPVLADFMVAADDVSAYLEGLTHALEPVPA
jgi:hypothetical protein